MSWAGVIRPDDTPIGTVTDWRQDATWVALGRPHRSGTEMSDERYPPANPSLVMVALVMALCSADERCVSAYVEDFTDG